MRRADAVCAEYRLPNGVTFSFQVCTNSIEPPVPNRSFNLLTKDALRATLADEPEHMRPEVSLVGVAFLLARRRVGLAGTRASPDGSIIGPSSQSKSEGPSADAREEVDLRERFEVGRVNFGDATLIDFTLRNQTINHQFPKPSGSAGIELVEVGRPHAGPPIGFARSASIESACR